MKMLKMSKTEKLRLSREDQQRLVDLLTNPPELNQAMKRASQAHVELIQPPKN